MLRALFGLILRRVGYPRPIAEEIVASLWSHRRRLAVVFVAAFATPLLELGVIGTLYALVSTEYQDAIREQLGRFAFTAGLADQFGPGATPVLALAVVAVVVLTLLLGAKFAHGGGLAYFQYAVYTKYAHRLMESYLNAAPTVAARVNRDRIANGVLMQASAFGKSVSELMDVFTQLLTATLFLLGALRTSAELVVACLVVAVVVSFVARDGFRREREIGRRKAQVQPRLLGRTADLLHGYTSAKIIGAESYLARDFGGFLEVSQRWRLDRKWNELRTRALTDVVVYLAILFVIVVAMTVVQLDTALLLVFMVIMARLQRTVTTLQSLWIRLNHSIPALEMAHDLIQTCEDSAYSDGVKAARRPPEPLEFAGVSYRYRDDGDWVLNDIDMIVQPGERILVHGASGSGKSTLLYLACGLLDPTKGRISYGDQVLDERSFYALRDGMAYVGEGAYLFRDSIRENLTLGRDFSETELDEALRKARLLDVVRASPDGIDSPIGENGRDLSLGERQRVMLAQVFLRDPAIVFLDEATANLDIKLERDIMSDLLTNLSPSTTLLMVAHRHPTDVRFDRVFRLQDGVLSAERFVGVAGT